jgi:hypothetical protein
VKYYINSVPCENPVDRRKVWRKLGVLTEAVPSKVVAPFLSIVVVEIERKIWNSVTLLIYCESFSNGHWCIENGDNIKIKN